jgi:hypothetical protein
VNWTVIGVVIGAIGIIIAVASGLSSDIDKRIEAQLKSPEFVKKVAEQVRLPFIIFDENDRVLVNSGGEDYIESISVSNDDSINIQIVVLTKRFLHIAPLLQNLDGKMQFYDPERIGQNGWKFKSFEHGYIIDHTNENLIPPPRRFRLEIIP